MSLQDELTERMAQGLRGRLARFEPRVLSWLLLLPEWTAAQWPFGDDLIGRFEASGLIEQRETFDGEAAFWVRDSVRPELARYVRETRGTQLEADVAELARSTSLSTLIQYRDDPSGQSLMRAVEALIRDGKLGEATRLTASARLLGEALNDPLADSARRARWRIDRAIRTAEDQRRLQHYVHRRGIEEAFRALLDEEFPYYVLHLLGDGGTGKTMAIRHLCNTSGIHVARVDFDYLDPRYPDQRPGEILLALAGELLGYGTTREAYARYRRLQDAVDAVHEELASVAQPGRGPALTEMTRAFAEFATSFGYPVLLILDTCEELAKLYLPGTGAPAIDQTFRIIEMVHSRNPFIRFVLAGRRWLVPPSNPVSAAAGPVLRPRPYVSVQPVSGFTRAEALTYIQVRQVRSEAMTEALLRRAAAPDGTFNPFELSSFCEWAVSDPGLDPAELAAAPGDPLVERRIVGRTSDGIRAALPIAAALGRFDLDLTASALRRSGLDPVTAFRELSGQEWVNILSVDAAGYAAEIEVDQHLRDRILRTTAARYPVDRQALGRDAVAALERSGELSATPVSTVEAAVRLLPSAEAGEFWARLEQRIADQDAWAWAAQAATRAGAVESERVGAEGEGPTILAAILATQAAARLRTGGDVIPLWREVEGHADRHPDPAQARKLTVRGMLGRLAAGDREIDPASVPGEIDLAGSYLAAAQRLVADGRDAYNFAARACTTSPEGDWRIWALSVSLMAVIALWREEVARAGSLAADAERAAHQTEPTRAWADWIPPSRVLDRCRLTALFIAFVTGGNAPSWQSWRNDALGYLHDIEAERLISLTFRYQRGFGPVPDTELRRILSAERYVLRRPVDWLHFQVRPLIVEIAAQRWTDRDGSFQILQERIDEAVAAGDDPDTVDACQLAQMRLYRRHRFVDGRVVTLSQEGSPIVRAEAWLVRTLVDGEYPDQAESASEELPHGFDPEQLLRSGGSIDGMPPGERGRAMLAVGEVLALRSPSQAVALLRDAVEPLRVAGDQVSAAQAVVLTVLAEARSSVSATVPHPGPLSDVAATDLPSTWATRLEFAEYLYADELVPSTFSDPSPELQFPAPAPQPPDLPMDSCKVCGHPMGLDDAFCEMCGTAFRGGQARSLPSTVPSALTPAPAPYGQPAPEVSPAPGETPATAPPRRRVRRLLIGGTLALVVIAALVTGVALGATHGSHPGTGPGVHTPSTGVSPLIIIVPVVAGLVIAALAALAFASRRRQGLRLEWAYFPGIERIYHTVTVTRCSAAQLGEDALARLLSLRPVRYETVYHYEADEPPQLPALPAGGKRPAIFKIHVGPELDERSWEQWLGRCYPRDRAADLLYFRVQTRGALVDQARMAGYAYQGPAHILDVTASTPTDRAIHLVGTPVSTKDGWRLRVTGTGGTPRTSRGVEEGESLLSPASLKNTPLVILQADPVDGGPRPLGEDRTGFIRLAREFTGNGTRAVFVIPPLGDALARTAARLMRIMVDGLPPSPRTAHLLKILAELKRLLRPEAQPVNGEDPILDVLLFVNERRV